MYAPTTEMEDSHVELLTNRFLLRRHVDTRLKR